MTTTKQRLESKIRKYADGESDRDNKSIIIGANLLAPLLLEMVEALKIANSGYNEFTISKVETALNKFEEFLK
jgi:hypothetical protein